MYGPVGMVLLNASDEHKGTDIDRHPFIDKCEENARSKEQDEHPEDYFLDYFHAVFHISSAKIIIIFVFSTTLFLYV